MTVADAEWRSPTERAELVARLIKAEKANRVIEDELRQRIRREELYLAGHPDVAALMARVKELEGIVQRLNERISRRKSA